MILIFYLFIFNPVKQISMANVNGNKSMLIGWPNLWEMTSAYLSSYHWTCNQRLPQWLHFIGQATHAWPHDVSPHALSLVAPRAYQTLTISKAIIGAVCSTNTWRLACDRWRLISKSTHHQQHMGLHPLAYTQTPVFFFFFSNLQG